MKVFFFNIYYIPIIYVTNYIIDVNYYFLILINLKFVF